jgi:MYXO-CTERM domain-containing protein
MADDEMALIAPTGQSVASVPAADEWLGTFAETEPVPVDGRLGWNIHRLRLDDLRSAGALAEPELWLDSDLVPCFIEEENVGEGVWFWFTPDAALVPETDYLFEFGDEEDMSIEFLTGRVDLQSVDAGEQSATLRTTWNPVRPGVDASLITEITVSVNRTATGSSRLSVIRIFAEDEDGGLVLREVRPVGVDRTVFFWWQDWPEAGRQRPEQVCVGVVHENGLAEESDLLDLCGEPTVNRGCSVASASPGAAGGLAVLLLPLIAIRRRRSAWQRPPRTVSSIP